MSTMTGKRIPCCLCPAGWASALSLCRAGEDGAATINKSSLRAAWGLRGHPPRTHHEQPTEQHDCCQHTQTHDGRTWGQMGHSSETLHPGRWLRPRSTWALPPQKPWWTPSRLFSTTSPSQVRKPGKPSAAPSPVFTPSAMDLFCGTRVSSSSGLSWRCFQTCAHWAGRKQNGCPTENPVLTSAPEVHCHSTV